MKKKFKIGFLLICIMSMFFITGCDKKSEETDKQEMDNVTIKIHDKEKNEIYSNDVETDEKKLDKVLEQISDEIQLEKESGDYGTYIVSLMGIEQGDGYYWVYYIGDEYATVGVSEYKIKDGETYNFYIEKYE